jgi:hypothetical protein
MPSTKVKGSKSKGKRAKAKVELTNEMSDVDLKEKKSKAKGKKKSKVVSKSQKEKKAKPKTRVKAKSAGKKPAVKSSKPLVTNPTTGDETGLNLSVPRVKTIIDDKCLNKRYSPVAKLIRTARGGVLKKKDGDVEIPQVPIDELSEEVLSVLEEAKLEYVKGSRGKYEKQWLKDLSDSKPAKASKYREAKKLAKLKHESDMLQYVESEREEFDMNSFNIAYDKSFYSEFDDSDLPTGKDKNGGNWDVWQQSANCVSKMKVRFSADSKIYLTAFLEHIMCQLAYNGTINCFLSGNKIVKVKHVVDTTHDGAADRMPVHRILKTLNCYKTWTSESD